MIGKYLFGALNGIISDVPPRVVYGRRTQKTAWFRNQKNSGIQAGWVADLSKRPEAVQKSFRSNRYFNPVSIWIGNHTFIVTIARTTRTIDNVITVLI